MFETDTRSEVFEKIWPGGYIETFEGYYTLYGSGLEQRVAEAGLRPFFNARHCTLEIGCGGGLWVKKYLAPNFASVICLDVVQQKFTLPPNTKYIQVPEKDFNCTGVDDNSIDFAWSFGVFCHLSFAANQAYLKSLFNKLKTGRSAVIMFADWDRHPDFKDAPPEKKEHWKNQNMTELGGTWFCNTLKDTRKIVEEAGFVSFKDLLPDFRDTLAMFTKP